MKFALVRLPLSTQLIGVDGGATAIKAHEVEFSADAAGPALRIGARRALRVLPRIGAFETPAERGLGVGDELGPPTPAEEAQAWAWIEATAACIVELARARAAKDVLVGVAMPGLKTDDERGIRFALNGPRAPDFVERLEHLLASDGVELCRPIERLHSDGWCCGLGEECGAGGLLRGVSNAYYLGGGTGLAEALKVDGSLLAFEGLEDVLPKAWRLRTGGEVGFEALLSAHGINSRYAAMKGLGLPLNEDQYPEVRAARDPVAARVLADAGRKLGELIGERLRALAALPDDQPLLPGPIVLERVVIGQRLGQLLADPRTGASLDAAFRHTLFRRAVRDELVGEFYDELRFEHAQRSAHSGERPSGLVALSPLRAAPAIGAAAAAWIDWSRARA